MGPTRTRVYRGGALAGEDFPVTAVSDHLAEPDTVVWVDYCDPSAEQLHELADELGLHELAVEDALEPTSDPSSTTTPPTSSCRATRHVSTSTPAGSTRPRSTPSSTIGG